MRREGSSSSIFAAEASASSPTANKMATSSSSFGETRFRGGGNGRPKLQRVPSKLAKDFVGLLKRVGSSRTLVVDDNDNDHDETLQPQQQRSALKRTPSNRTFLISDDDSCDTGVTQNSNNNNNTNHTRASLSSSLSSHDEELPSSQRKKKHVQFDRRRPKKCPNDWYFCSGDDHEADKVHKEDSASGAVPSDEELDGPLDNSNDSSSSSLDDPDASATASQQRLQPDPKSLDKKLLWWGKDELSTCYDEELSRLFARGGPGVSYKRALKAAFEAATGKNQHGQRRSSLSSSMTSSSSLPSHMEASLGGGTSPFLDLPARCYEARGIEAELYHPARVKAKKYRQRILQAQPQPQSRRNRRNHSDCDDDSDSTANEEEEQALTYHPEWVEWEQWRLLSEKHSKPFHTLARQLAEWDHLQATGRMPMARTMSQHNVIGHRGRPGLMQSQSDHLCRWNSESSMASSTVGGSSVVSSASSSFASAPPPSQPIRQRSSRSIFASSQDQQPQDSFRRLPKASVGPPAPPVRRGSSGMPMPKRSTDSVVVAPPQPSPSTPPMVPTRISC